MPYNVRGGGVTSAYTVREYKSSCHILQLTNYPLSGRGHGHMMSKFWEISDNNLKTVQVRRTVSIQVE